MPHKMMNPQIAYVLHDNRLSIEARMLYAYLCSFDDGRFGRGSILLTNESRRDFLAVA